MGSGQILLARPRLGEEIRLRTNLPQGLATLPTRCTWYSPAPIEEYYVLILLLSYIIIPFPFPIMKDGNEKPPSLYSQENIMALSNAKYSGGINSLLIGSPGKAALDDAMQKAINTRNGTRIGTWNTRGLFQTGKLHTVEQEAKAAGLDVLGILETHRTGNGYFKTKAGNTVYFSGNDTESRNGVAFILTGPTAKAVLGYRTVNDHIITVKIRARPININVIQVYAPTAKSSEETVEAFFDQLSRTINVLPKQEILIILGDMNAKVGQTTTIKDHLKQIIGPFGLGIKNKRGDRMLQFCQEQSLTIANTIFQFHNRRLYTWKSPGNRYRNQIDYIMVRSRCKSSIRNCRTYPRADCGSDHQLLVMQFKIRFKKIKHLQKKAINIPEPMREKFREEIQNKLMDGKARITSNKDPNKEWEALKDIIKEAAERLQQDDTLTIQPNKHWITQRTLDTIKERKKIKNKGLLTEKDSNVYRKLSKKIQRQCGQDKNNHIKEVCREIEESYQRYRPI
ncbi:uncharacterized protein [Anoplolepis gracilipes]|uniref:uncharacterized protein n=1 Tax=Anoplolepis gracilipes TaxID=354296 RepID=UPI003BA303C2